jgi:aminocarboxymuconate-semialdehyde decarboxylase
MDGDDAIVHVLGNPFRKVTRAAWDPQKRLEDMDATAVRHQVLSPMPELFCYWADAHQAASYCRYMNDWLGAHIDDRFDCFGIIPMQDPEMAAAELEHVSRLGLRGVEVGSNVEGQYLHTTRYEVVLAEAERLDLAMFIHPFHPPGFETITGGPAASGVTFPNEVGFALGGLIAEGVLESHPSLRLLASHGGGSLGLLLPRLDRMWNMDPGFRERLPGSPSSYAKRLYVDLLVFSPKALQYVLSVVGDDRVVVGSDYPFMPDPPGAVLDEFDDLDDELRGCICDQNAGQLLWRGERSARQASSSER